jgi:hypothetical protein
MTEKLQEILRKHFCTAFLIRLTAHFKQEKNVNTYFGEEQDTLVSSRKQNGRLQAASMLQVVQPCTFK